jgi:hypothetical protein
MCGYGIKWVRMLVEVGGSACGQGGRGCSESDVVCCYRRGSGQQVLLLAVQGRPCALWCTAVSCRLQHLL